jgi:hypothetical protein
MEWSILLTGARPRASRAECLAGAGVSVKDGLPTSLLKFVILTHFAPLPPPLPYRPYPQRPARGHQMLGTGKKPPVLASFWRGAKFMEEAAGAQLGRLERTGRYADAEREQVGQRLRTAVQLPHSRPRACDVGHSGEGPRLDGRGAPRRYSREAAG